MIDFIGQELNIGDKIIGIAHHSASSVLFGGIIKRMTNKKLIVEVIKYNKVDEWRFKPRVSFSDKETSCNPEKQIYPEKVIKVNSLGDITNESS